jgi:hypothetical protein
VPKSRCEHVDERHEGDPDKDACGHAENENHRTKKPEQHRDASLGRIFPVFFGMNPPALKAHWRADPWLRELLGPRSDA